MKFQLPIVVVILTSIGTFHSATALAEVKSLSSSELTDTYIKDSTIIITPKKKKKDTEQKTYSSLTIAPVENNDIAISDLKNVDSHLKNIKVLDFNANNNFSLCGFSILGNCRCILETSNFPVFNEGNNVTISNDFCSIYLNPLNILP